MIINLFKFAKNKKDIKMKLNEDAWNVIVHIAKLYLFNDYEEYRSHWMKEIRSFLFKVSLLKNNKYPSAELILKNIWCDTYKNRIVEFMQEAVDDEEELTPMYDINDKDVQNAFYLVCEEYLIWISNKLSETGFVSTQEVKNKLNELYL